MNEYVESRVPAYVESMNLSVGGTLSYSNPINLYDFNTNEVVGAYIFVLDEDEIIGKMEIHTNNNDYSSVFDAVIPSEIQNSYDNNIGVALGYYDHNILLYTSADGYSYVDGTGKIGELPASTNLTTQTIIPQGEIIYNPISVCSESLGSKNLSVTHVHNQEYSTDKFVCWAACVAMTSNYLNGTSYTALDVYDKVKSKYDDTTLGSPDCILEAYTKCSVSNIEYREKAIKANTVFTSLSSNVPVQINVSGYSNNKELYHAILITGIHLYSDYTVYTVDDPDYSDGTRSFDAKGTPVQNVSSIEYSGMNDKGGSMIYTSWYRSFYSE